MKKCSNKFQVGDLVIDKRQRKGVVIESDDVEVIVNFGNNCDIDFFLPDGRATYKCKEHSLVKREEYE
jgi:hypothetical protein